MKFDIAVVGATGVVGEAVFEILAEREFPVGKIYPLASAQSVDKTVSFKNRKIDVIALDDFDFSQVQLAIFSAGAAVSKQFVPIAAEAGCVVIDNTSAFREDIDVPLVIPEVNPLAIAGYKNRNIIANPNCSTIQLLVAVHPIYEVAGIRRINVATYQSVSGAGRLAIEELAHQSRQLMSGESVAPKAFKKQIAFNLIPEIDTMEKNNYTREEMKMFRETQKILNDENILVNATAVRVPVFYGHSEAVHLETRNKISLEQVELLLTDAPGVIYMPDDLPTPVDSLKETDAVFVGRVREDISHPLGINLWVVADNIRKGGALNAVQIAEILVNQYF